jgi:hypothetical protein
MKWMGRFRAAGQRIGDPRPRIDHGKSIQWFLLLSFMSCNSSVLRRPLH